MKTRIIRCATCGVDRPHVGTPGQPYTCTTCGTSRFRRRYDSSRRRSGWLKRAFDAPERLEPQFDSRAEAAAYRRAQVLPGDRRCPLCGCVKLKSRQWVVLNDNQKRDLLRYGSKTAVTAAEAGVICRACAMKRLAVVLW